MAELDAMDMAEIAARRTSADKHLRDADDPGPPPASLRHALTIWYLQAAFALVSVVYGFSSLGTIQDALRASLTDGVVRDPDNAAPAGKIDSLSSTVPPILLVGILVALAIQYPLLVAIARRHSRSCRNFYVTVVVITALAIPVGIDLLFGYPEIPTVMSVVAWVQLGLVVLSALFTFRREVNLWLPEPMRLRPGRTTGY
ncbi:hypothetical protein GCM10009722_15750 [Williamsia deligens]|nr:hypothetical protein [Williamsia deligens]